MLVYFKYYNFSVTTVNRLFSLSIATRSIVAPLGVSFITFSAVSYFVDISRGDAKPGSLLDTALTSLTGRIVGVAFVSVSFASILIGLITQVLDAGYKCYCLGVHRREEMPYESLFDGFTFAGKVIALYIVEGFFVALWSMLFVIPGIIAAYRYSFAMLNLCENPDLGVMEALDLSKRQTNGYKMQLFLLQLSFISYQLAAALIAVLYEYAIISFLPDSLPGVLLGTLIYSVLAAGVGVYLTPYLNLSICRFYLLATGNQAGGAEPPHTDPWDTQF